jgi:hypothetical protein
METLVTLLAAHVLGDFVFQNDAMSRRKREPLVLLLHVIIVTALSLLLLGNLHWPIILGIFLLHLLIDATKVWLLGPSFRAFLIDQELHLVVIVALAALYPRAAVEGWWPALLGVGHFPYYLAGLSLLTGIVLVIPAGGILVGMATQPLLTEIGEEAITGLRRGGRLIGYLERGLVLLLILINQPAGIGFLIATKSILRFGEVRNPGQRKVAEYIIIGTFLSFGWALLIAVLTRSAIRFWIG